MAILRVLKNAYTEKYISFSKNVVKTDTSTKEKRPETYRLKTIDSYRSMHNKL